MTSSSVAETLIAHSVERLEHYLAQIRRCIGLLDDGVLWHRPNAHVNSVANLVLHLTGNVRQWILGGVGGLPIDRDRPAEFAASGGLSAAEVLDPLTAVVCDAITVLRELPHDALTEPRDIQGYAVTVETAILHVVEHFAFHAGQIIHATKWLKDVDLSLYDPNGRRIDGSGNP